MDERVEVRAGLSVDDPTVILCHVGSMIIADNVVRNGEVADAASIDPRRLSKNSPSKFISPCHQMACGFQA